LAVAELQALSQETSERLDALQLRVEELQRKEGHQARREAQTEHGSEIAERLAEQEQAVAALQEEAAQAQKDHQLLRSEVLGADYSGRIAEVLARIDSGEEASAALGKRLVVVASAAEEARAVRRDLEDLRQELEQSHAEEVSAQRMTEESLSAVTAQLEQLRRDQDCARELLSENGGHQEALDAVQSTRKEIDQLREQHRELASSSMLAGINSDRMDEAFSRLSRGEEATALLKERLERAEARVQGHQAGGDEALEAKLEQVRVEHRKHADGHEERLKGLISRLESSEGSAVDLRRDVDALREERCKASSTEEPEKGKFEQVEKCTEATEKLDRRLQDNNSALELRLDALRDDLAREAESRADQEKKLEDLMSKRDVDHKTWEDAKRELRKDVDRIRIEIGAASSGMSRELELRLDVIEKAQQRFCMQLERQHDQQDLTEKISEVLRRISFHEERTESVQIKVELAVKAMETRLTQLAKAGVELSGNHSEEVASSGEIEQRVKELRRKVEDELKAAEVQQRELVKAVPVGAGVALGGPGSLLVAQVETRVEELARTVDEEAKALQQHHQRMTEARLQKYPSPENVEARVKELSDQVAGELSALVSQQEEMRKTKATLASLSEKMTETCKVVDACQKATSEVKAKQEERELQVVEQPRLQRNKAGDLHKPLDRLGGLTSLQATRVTVEGPVELSESYEDDALDESSDTSSGAGEQH